MEQEAHQVERPLSEEEEEEERIRRGMEGERKYLLDFAYHSVGHVHPYSVAEMLRVGDEYRAHVVGMLLRIQLGAVE